MSKRFKNPEDFKHNHCYILIRCSICVRFIKPKNHNHAYKNISGLWWHTKTEHKDLSDLQLNEIEEILRKISIAVHLGMLGF